MAATAKQLASLKKARAARKRNLAAAKRRVNAKPKPRARAKPKKKPVKKRVTLTEGRVKAKRAAKRQVKNVRHFLYAATSNNAEKKYWFTGADFSDRKSDAKPISHTVAMNTAKKYKRYEALKGKSFFYTGSIVKKPSGGRESNPVPPSKRVKLRMAAKLFEDFTGHDANEVIDLKVNAIDVGIPFGVCDGILYTTVRDGKTEKYIHNFKKSSRPTLIANYDGKKLAIVGGNFRFTERGIEDR
jgi:hypothetical protein